MSIGGGVLRYYEIEVSNINDAMKGLLFALLIAAAGHAHAHDLWLEKQGGTLVLLKGHRYSSHGGAAEIEYSPDEVLRVLCFDPAGVPREVPSRKTYPLEIQGDCAASYVLTSSGYWSKTPFGTKNLPKDEARQPIRSWLSYESVKRLDAWNRELARLSGVAYAGVEGRAPNP